MNSELIDTHVLNILKDGGWCEERKYNISFWIERLSEEGYICFEYAKEILMNLGEITINTRGDNEHKGAQFDFDPFGAASGEYDRLHDFELVAGENLFPIGSMCSAIVYVGRSKNIYWGDWKEFYWSGSSIEDYLNRLFDKKTSPKQLDFIDT